jgi:hypothetical protein
MYGIHIRQQPFFNRTSSLHLCNHKFALTPCNMGILHFCHDLDLFFCPLLLDYFDMEDELQGSWVVASSPLPLRGRF